MVDPVAISVDNVNRETFSASRPCVHKSDRRKGQRNCNLCHATYMRAWRKTHPMTTEQRQKDNARSYANVYKRRGKIVARPCAVCDGTDNLEMHHPDYSKPTEICWMCRSCHLRLHAGTLATVGVAAC